MSKTPPSAAVDYQYWLDIPTRWNDNDQYGHVNNAVYYFYFDTIVNKFLIENGLLVLGNEDEASNENLTDLGLVVETGCQFFASFTYPETVRTGLRVTKLGSSSIRYEIGLFKKTGDGTNTENATEPTARVQGHFVHVNVDAVTRKPKPISDKMRQIMSTLMSD